jgi:hypothetical protein
MALIRGFRGLCPCPVCLVPSMEQRNIMKQYPSRTASDTRTLIQQAWSKDSEAEKEEILKSYGLRVISVSSKSVPILANS